MATDKPDQAAADKPILISANFPSLADVWIAVAQADDAVHETGS